MADARYDLEQFQSKSSPREQALADLDDFANDVMFRNALSGRIDNTDEEEVIMSLLSLSASPPIFDDDASLDMEWIEETDRTLGVNAASTAFHVRLPSSGGTSSPCSRGRTYPFLP
ncbi:MAG: hypothetical protein M2R45_00048 [Verrucomicrobia subdivision 3 bacterium]|nr:hypothetical protein [Limisphaerales bacterium]MCS1412493.1 hypothetical protein [Limisphaerales bacterium]